MRPQAVLDASAALHAVLTQEHASEVLDFLHGTALVLVPALFTSEVTNGLWKYVRSGQITRHRAIQLLDQALKLVDSVVDDRDLAREALVLAAAHSHPAYDALYAVLARRNGCPLLTFDRRLVKLLGKLGVEAWVPASST